MTFEIRKAPIETDLLKHLFQDLVELLPQAEMGDFSGALVVLPSSRACLTLGQVILENHSLDTLLLPRTVTLTQIVGELAVALGLEVKQRPGGMVRSLVLAHHLKKENWLKDRPESASGLAEEFIALFDEVRLYGCAVEVLENGSTEDLVRHVHAEAALDLEADLKRIRRVWEIYRDVVGQDETDLLCEVAAAVSESEQAAFRREILMVAGFANLDPVRASLLRSLGGWSRRSCLYLPDTNHPLSDFFASTFSGNDGDPDQPGGLDPLAPGRLVARLLASDKVQLPNKSATGTLREKVASLAEAGGEILPGGPLQLRACGTAEDESQFVAAQVVEVLKKPGGNREKTAVVTNDPVLAVRIVAQLRDAGVDVDQTQGAPLSSLPAGLLLRFLLRSVLTDFRADSLLEVLTHPYVTLATPDGKIEKWNLRLEGILRRHQGGQLGAAGMLKLAKNRDEAARRIMEKDQPGLEVFVETILQAFSPLATLTNKRSWAELLGAVVMVWNNLCPGEPLQENKEKSDITALARLLARLQDSELLLPEVKLGEFSADLGRMLSAESVAPHRGQAKPVLVTGTVEARLEKYDNLFLAGMAEGKFPARRPRPLFLGFGLRKHLGLPDWRQAAARDSALFLRLLFNAPQVLVTWPSEIGGHLVLPSPFVARLALALPDQGDPQRAARMPLWRKGEADFEGIEKFQKGFSKETLTPLASEKTRPLNTLSWSSLRTWRDCPYRYLLGRGFYLRKEEEVREEFGRRDYGSLVHQSLYNFLLPGGAGYEALLGGKDTEARRILAACAQAEFLEKGDDTAGRRLWLASFQKCVPAIVSFELNRFQDWRPVLLEKGFELPLADVLVWLEKENQAGEMGLDIPSQSSSSEPVILRGTIDRVDEQVSLLDPQRRQGAILDYKTGKMPTAKAVQELRDLQIILYAIAVEVGAVPAEGNQPWVVTEGSYYEIQESRAGIPGKNHLSCQGPEGRELLARGGLALVQMALSASNPDQEFGLIPQEIAGEGELLLPCRYCEFLGVCRLEERVSGYEATALKVDKMVNRKEGSW